MADTRMSLKDYEDSLRGGLWDEEEIQKAIDEMKQAEIGKIKADCWEKVSEDEFIIFAM